MNSSIHLRVLIPSKKKTGEKKTIRIFEKVTFKSRYGLNLDVNYFFNTRVIVRYNNEKKNIHIFIR